MCKIFCTYKLYPIIINNLKVCSMSELFLYSRDFSIIYIYKRGVLCQGITTEEEEEYKDEELY